MKKILITGAAGYIGAKLSEYLKGNSYKITALCHSKLPSSNHKWKNLYDTVIVGDLRKDETIYTLLKENYDIIIHLVSLDHKKSENDPNIVASINILPIWNLLNNFSKKNSLDKFIYFSTFQVYGKVPPIKITEDFIPSPRNNYGLTHLLSENICNFYNIKTDISCLNVRLSNSYGSPVFKENNCWWLVINDLCKTAFNKNKIILLSDGSPQRDFIHISDVSKAIKILIEMDRNNIKENTYNISSGTTLTILELAHAVKRVFQKRYKKEIPILLPDNSISENLNQFRRERKYIIDNSRIKSLGFKPEIDLESGINELFDYLETQNGT